MDEKEVSLELAKEHGITAEEWEKIFKILGRKPTYPELGIFQAMWSEHCSYKSSRLHLKTLPTQAEWVLQGPGENAGVIDIGDGWAVAFKMESHNHPSFIEPYQGAATGVGGILRDVFTMGARPLANLNGLFFGAPDHQKTPFLMRGVVAGVGDYGNCIGVPTVGGQVTFHPCYNGNNLVNAFTLGVLRGDRIFRGKAEGVGNPVWYVGSKTGRDGIHGATMASAEFSEETEEKKPTVQVGDPFTEKLLLEACLEIMQDDFVLGIQDMGAAGLTSSSLEMAERAGSGIRIDLSKIPLREKTLTPYEILLSESQERMLFVAKKGFEKEILSVFRKWNLDAVQIGEVTDTQRAEFFFDARKVADIPIAGIGNEAPLYDRPSSEPENLAEMRTLDIKEIGDIKDPQKVFLDFIASPHLCSRKWVFTQYDQSVRTNTVQGPNGDAGVIRIKGTNKAIAMSLDVNPRYCNLDPRLGAMIAVAESALNVACSGAKPLGVTDCLNFGNPEKPRVMWEFKEAIAGLREACLKLGTPVVSGNVSFYNETEGIGIYPTPSIGMVGLIEDASKTATPFFKSEDSHIILLGKRNGTLGGSLYLSAIKGMDRGNPPALDLDDHLKLIELVLELIGNGIVESVHDVSEGGLLPSLAECCLSPSGDIGAEIHFEALSRIDELFFGESASRVIISANAGALEQVLKLAERSGVAALKIGVTRKNGFNVFLAGKKLVSVDITEIREAWENGIDRILK
jgi:phosphoribosylformylglycinamidine synthase subunit PurL